MGRYMGYGNMNGNNHGILVECKSNWDINGICALISIEHMNMPGNFHGI